MDCPECPAEMVVFQVPAEYREHAPEGAEHAAICPDCLALAAAEPPADERFDRLGEAFPDGEAAVPMALLVGLLDSLALNRASLEALVAEVEERGADPMLVIDRVARQGTVQPAFDLDRRRHQLAQLLE